MRKKTKYNFLDWRTVLAMGTLVVLSLLVISAIDSRKASRISAIEVDIRPLEGMTFLIQPDEVKNIIYEGYRRDVEELTIQDIDISTIEQVLESEPFIEDANVYINADHRLGIDVDQAKPAIRIMDNIGRSYYLSMEGNAFPVSRHASARVPVFSGNIPKIEEVHDSLTMVQLGVIELMTIISKDKFAQKMIEQVHVSGKGEFLVQPKLGKFKFDLGKPIKLEDKMNRFELSFKEVIPKKGWTKYRVIDLSFDDQIICKK